MNNIKITYRYTLCGQGIGIDNSKDNLYGCMTIINDTLPITPVEFLEILMKNVSNGNIVTDIRYKIVGNDTEYKTVIQRCT